ncbi:MAG: HEAT repeat domain-containing protein [Thermostichus sp. HHBFW_bins_43]
MTAPTLDPVNPDRLQEIAQQLQSQRPADRMVALAHLRHVPDEDAVPLILQVVDDENLQVRSFAVFALGVKQTEASLPKLLEILTQDPDYGIRADAAGALGYLEDPRAFEALVRAFYEDVEWLVRFSAAVALGNLKDPRAYEVLLRALDAPEVLLQQAAIAALGEVGDLRALDRILAFAQSEDWLVRQRLAQALGNLPAPKSVAALNYLSRDPHDSVAAAALDSLRRLQQKGFTEA